MNDKYLNEIMHAYAAGCLDHEDLIPFLEMMSSNGEITSRELGELQNLTSLLPAILMLENPPASAKDNIAKKLYAIREEMLAKKAQEKEIQQHKHSPEEEILSDRMSRHEKSSRKDLSEKHDLSVPVPEQNHTKDQEHKHSKKVIPEKHHYEEHHPEQPPLPSKKESKATLIALIVIFILLIAGAAGAVYSLLQQKIEEQQKNNFISKSRY